MNYLRNPEVKKELLAFTIFYIVVILVGVFVFGRETGIYMAVTGLLFLCIHFVISYRRYQRISGMAALIDQVIHTEKIISFENQREGELSLLESQIQKMFHKLKRQTELLKKEKTYLADSIADISHQIRTPLTAMNLIVTRLEKIYSGQRLLLDLEKSLRHVDWLIETLLKLAKFDAGTIELKQDPVSVSLLCRRAAEPLEISMELKEQLLLTKCGENCTFTGDLAWMTEALSNILKNCVEHTPKGGEIRIMAAENTLFTEILVEDNGSGFAGEDLPHLFERFYSGHSNQQESVGIGLALAKTIIRQQNGTLSAENRKEGGARFRIRFYKSVI